MSYDFYITTYPVIGVRKPRLLNPQLSSKNTKNQHLYKPSWMKAISYCNQLSLAHNLSPIYCEKTGKLLETYHPHDFVQQQGFRLPTAKEWEYAAQAWHKICGSYTEIQRQHYRIPFLDYPTTPAELEYYTHGYSRVDQLIPNEIGVYGVLVYGKEWCTVTESYYQPQNRRVHWQEYFTNYNNDIGYSVTSTEGTEDDRYAFHVVLTHKLNEWQE